MRSKKELLEVVLKELPDRLITGICHVIDKLEKDETVCELEELVLRNIIKQNPTEYYSDHMYYFPYGELEPRIEYLQMLIKKYSDGQD